MPNKPRPPIRLGVKRLQQYHLLGRHPGEIPPLVPLAMLHDVVLAVAIPIPQMQLEEVLVAARLRVDHGERALLHDAVHGLPHVDEGDAAGEEVGCFVGEQLLHAEGRGFRGVVAVDEHDWRSLRRVFLVGEGLRGVFLRADRVVEDEDAGGAEGLLEEGNYLWVEGGADGLLVFPVRVRGCEGVEGEAVFVEGEGGCVGPGVVHGYFCGGIAGLVDGG